MKWPFTPGYRSRMRRELAEELESHIEEKIADLIDAGVAERDARQRARREFGNATLFTEIGRDVWGWNWLEILWKDIRYGLRGMRHNLAFTVVAVVTLGLGIGANTTTFSLIDAFFLRPLPVEEPYRLASVYANPHPDAGFCYPEYAYFRDHTTVFTGLAAHYSTAPLNVVSDGDSREAHGAVVSGNYFSVLGIKPLLGRFFAAEEDTVPDRDSVAVVSYGMWQRRFAGDPAIVGKTVKINGAPFSIIGVTPEDFHGVLMGNPNDMWIPTMMLRVDFAKQYVRDDRILRTEPATNNVYDYGVNKDVENLTHLREKMSEIIDRYHDVQQDVLETFIDRGQLRKLAEPTVLPSGRRIPGLKLDHPRQLAVMHSLVRFANVAANGRFTTADLYGPALHALGLTATDYSLASFRYDLSKLRAKGLVEKIPHSRRYQLAGKGYSICVAFLKLFERIYAPLTAGLLAPFRGDRALSDERRCVLDRLYQRICDDLEALLNAVGLRVAA